MTNSYVVQRIRDRYSYLTPRQIAGTLRHSSFVDLRKRYMYYAVPKAACTSMKTLIHDLEGGAPVRLICGGMDECRREMFIHARENVPLPSLVDRSELLKRDAQQRSDRLGRGALPDQAIDVA